MKEQDRTLQVLIVKQDDSFAAVALSADIWGYGMTYEDAVEDLEDHLKIQITFLIRSNKVELLNRPASPEYFELHDKCVVALIKGKPVPGFWIHSLPLYDGQSQLDNSEYSSSPALVPTSHDTGELRNPSLTHRAFD